MSMTKDDFVANVKHYCNLCEDIKQLKASRENFHGLLLNYCIGKYATAVQDCGVTLIVPETCDRALKVSFYITGYQSGQPKYALDVEVVEVVA